MQPVTRYAKSGDVHIAYQVFGDGPINLVLAPYFVSNIEVYWEHPAVARWLLRLGSFARVAMFDKRGTGMSDRVPELPGLDHVWTTSGQLWTLQIWNRRRSLEHRKARPWRRCSLPPIRHGPVH